MSSDDIERQIMMEMEQEIKKNQSHNQDNSQVPPPFEFIPMPTLSSEVDTAEIEQLEGKLQARRLAEEEARREAEEEARREAEEEARRLAEEEARREAEEEAQRLAEEEARREAEQEARRLAEEEARHEAEEQARREAEQEARRLAEEEARREAEEEARRLAEEEARHEAEEQARREAEEEARRLAEEQARREAEEQARREAEEEARRLAEEEARREAEEEARRLAEEEARREAEEEARRLAEEEARHEAEEQARREAEEEAQRLAEEQARREAEEQARREAEEEARRLAEEEARREAEEEARRLAEEEARREAEEEARRLAEEEARHEAEEQARREAEEEAQRLAEEQARREAEEQARREAEEEARRLAEEEARHEAEEQARREAEEEAQRLAEEQARREAEEQARREAEEEARRLAEEEARHEAEEQARREAEEQARRLAEEQARREAEEQARREAEEQARRLAEEQARREAEEQARREAEEQARRLAEEQARREAEEQARREAEEQARRLAEEQARREAEEQARHEAEEQARRLAEEQARREAEEQARREAEEQARRLAEVQARREAEEQARREAEEEAQRLAEEQARREAEEQARREAEEEARRLAEEEARHEAEEQARREAEEEAQRLAEEQARREAEEQARREAEEEARRLAEEEARHEAEEQARREAEEQARRLAEEQARREAEEQARKASLEEIRRKAREAVFAEYAAKGVLKKPVGESASSSDIKVENSTPHLERSLGVVEEKSTGGIDANKSTESDEKTDNQRQSDGDFDLPQHQTNDDMLTKSVYSEASQDDNQSRFSQNSKEAMSNTNGILTPFEDYGKVDFSEEKSIESFEEVFHATLENKGLSENNVLKGNMLLQRFPTIREEGKCLFPPGETAVIPPHARIQLGFFSAKQTIMFLQLEKNRHLAEREMPCGVGQRSLSTLKCYFENSILLDETLTVDDENCPYNAPTEKLVSKDEIMRGDGKAVNKAVSSLCYGDPVQVYEKMLGTPNSEITKEGPEGNSPKNESTERNLWVADVETKKPIPALRTFTGGSVICVTASKLSSNVSKLHGEGTDPLIIAGAFFSLGERRKSKVSETFYFDSALDIFYPHKERKELAKVNKVVAFIPAEFRGTLHFVFRVFRPCCEDFENYVDLYQRTDKYKPNHVAPMKQDTLLMAQNSDLFEEMGWNFAAVDPKKNLKPVTNFSSIYRKPETDNAVLRLINDERSRNVLKSVPVDFQFEFSDLTKHEASFPYEGEEPSPEENESVVSLLNPDVPGALPEKYRYAPCCIPLLNSGYFTTYNNVYYFRVSKMRVSITGSLRNFPSSHRTYAIQICVKDKDDTLSEEGAIRCIYGRGLNNLTLDTSAWCSAVHSNNDNDLSEEFKIQLPLNLTEKHHIFFILHACHQRKTPPTPNTPLTFRVGYAAFPLIVNGAVQVKDSLDIKFVSYDKAAVAAAGGYLENFSKAPVTSLLNNGEFLLKASSQTKTTVYASNKIVSSIFLKCKASLESIRRDDNVLHVSGKLKELPIPPEDPHKEVITLISDLPLAEILAFYPFFSAYAFALIGSTSSSVSLPHRTHMLDTLLKITFRAQEFDTNENTLKRRHGTSKLSSVFSRTSASSILYYFLSNDPLYEGESLDHKYRLFAGLPEAWLHLLTLMRKNMDNDPASPNKTESKSSASANAKDAPKKKPGERSLFREMFDLSWFLFDAILRSIYIWGNENANLSRVELFDSSFYTLLSNLCVEVLESLSSQGEEIIIRRVAIFLRGLMHFCDRGQVLSIVQTLVTYFVNNSNFSSLTSFFTYILQDPNATTLLLPTENQIQPVFLTKILVDGFAVLLVQKNEEIRWGASKVLYNYISSLANDCKISGDVLTSVASQLFTLVYRIGLHWKLISQSGDKSRSAAVYAERRRLSATTLWIIYYTPKRHITQWLSKETDDKRIAGLFEIISDAQALFRYSNGDKGGESEESTLEVRRLWDARMTTFVTAIGTQMCNLVLSTCVEKLRTVKGDPHSQSAAVFPFFVMLESILNLNNSTISLQMSSAVLHQTVCQLFPEIISNKAKMSSGIILLTFRLMSSCCQYVRSSSGYTFLFMCQSFFYWKQSLSKIKSLTANALVTVAESKSRDLRLAGRFIEFQFDDLVDRAKVEEENFVTPSSDYVSRYEDDSNAPGGDTQMEYKYTMEESYESVQRVVPISRYLLERNASNQDRPLFSHEFSQMTVTVLSLFDDVLRLQVDTSMKFKESKIFAYFEVFRNFVRQNALKESVMWLYRLHEAHKANGDNGEAGLVLVFIAAICFRVTEVFYFVKGKQSKGARMPYAVLSHVYWQDYVRILPEVDALFSADTAYAIVSELFVCPNEPCFTVEGQVEALKVAAEYLDKALYYELAVAVVEIVNKFSIARSHFKDASAAHKASMTWCAAIGDNVKRHNNTYFCLWARMEREEDPKRKRDLQLYEEESDGVGEKPRGLPGGKPIKRIYKMPPNTKGEDFEEYAKGFIASLFTDESLVTLTTDLIETLPAIPEPDSKRKRVAAVQRSPNHCLVSAWKVEPYFEGVRGVPEGYDKSHKIQKFTSVLHVGMNEKTVGATKINVMNHCLNTFTFETDRSFPSTTCAIDVVKTDKELLDPFETAEKTLLHRRDLVLASEDNVQLIITLYNALSPMGMTPGAYVKEVIMGMNDHPEVIDAVRLFAETLREKFDLCTMKLDCMNKYPEQYAMVLKAVTDIECSLIDIESVDHGLE